VLKGKRKLALSVGEEGEQAAACFLRRLGWEILDRNWRHGPLELDLVCREGDTLVFVEVKTRAVGGLTPACEALTPTKRERLIRAARQWLAAHNAWTQPCRFDLAAVSSWGGQYQTELYRHVIELGDRHPVRCRHTAWQPW